ncbi:MAG: pseudouridine synthase [Myxococcaceae bacterium]
MERLQKFLSRAGVASRRHAETFITAGRVKVNGKVITELGTRVDAAKDLVLLDGKLVSASSERKYFLLYKPPGVVTTLSDPEGRPTIADYARETGGRVFPVGRLDYDAEGALILTDDGELANKLMHPSHQVPRVYLAKVKGEPDAPSLERLITGVRLEDGMARAVEARIFERAEKNTWVKLVVTEGRQHLIKRLCAAIGHPVVRLFRPAHAGIPVDGLKPGELRSLTNDEIRRVKSAADGETTQQPSLKLPARRHGHAAPGFEPIIDDDESPGEQRDVPDDAKPEGRREGKGGFERPRREDSRFGGRGDRREGGRDKRDGPGQRDRFGGERREGGRSGDRFGGEKREGGRPGGRFGGEKREGGRPGDRFGGGEKREGGRDRFGGGAKREGGRPGDRFGSAKREGGRPGDRFGGERREGGRSDRRDAPGGSPRSPGGPRRSGSDRFGQDRRDGGSGKGRRMGGPGRSSPRKPRGTW